MAKPTSEQLEHIQQLIEALESGEYKQIRNKLHDSKGYCCHGVACEVYRKRTGYGDWVQSSHDDTYAFLNEDVGLPVDVQKYYGAVSVSWQLDQLNTRLADLNDYDGKTFPEIAAILREIYFPESAEVPCDQK